MNMTQHPSSLARQIRAAAAGVTIAVGALALGGLAAQIKPAPVPPAQIKPAQQRLAPIPVRVSQGTLTLPTYELGPPDPNPPFDLFVTSRFNYPYTLLTNLVGKSAPHAWRALTLENEYLRCVVLPDLGGHLYGCTDKINGAEVFYANPSVKYAQIGTRGAWAALGVEFNFPVSHQWMTASPVDFATKTNPDGSASVWVANVDRPYGMQWRVELTLRPGTASLEQHTALYNRSDVRHRFSWWTNAAVQAWDDSRLIFPMQFSASHGFADVDAWPVDSLATDNSIVGNHTRGPVSRFSYGTREPFMAVYHPRTRAGVVHYSSPVDLSAKKVWSWGGNPDGLEWRRALSDNNSAYVEIQAGIFRNQETYGFLEPEDTVRFSEWWVPIRDLGGVSRATPGAVLNLTRSNTTGTTTTLTIALNVTRVLPNARVVVSAGGRTVGTEAASLGPEKTFTKSVSGLPASATYTVTLLDSAGAVLITHTEGRYDVTPAKDIAIGRQPSYTPPPAEKRVDGDIEAVGMQQELDGQRLLAMATYEDGLRRFPDSLPILKAAGRLAVDLKRFDRAAQLLDTVLARQNSDLEAWYYAGVARAALGNLRGARQAWELSQAYGAFRSASLLQLAALEARTGNRGTAETALARLSADPGMSLHAGGLAVALWRSLGRTAEAKQLLASLQEEDPTSNFFRVEATKLGQVDEALWRHLAADPERILEVAVDYLRAGFNSDAVELLARQYPSGPGVVSEVGMPRPEAYPLIAYYRGFAKNALGQNGRPDFDAASRLPTTYVFPNRPDTLAVLRQAVSANPEDATAHLLLGSLLLSGGVVDAAMSEWDTARRLNPGLPVLHRNMGYTMLATGGDPEKVIALLNEGTKADASNIGLYYGLDLAMTRANRPAADRANALLAYPDPARLPAALVYKLALALAEAGRFDEADRQFAGRFLPREEGGIDVRQVYLEVRIMRAQARAAQGDCAQTIDILNRLGDAVAGLVFTQDGLKPFIDSPRLQQMIGQARKPCGGRP